MTLDRIVADIGGTNTRFALATENTVVFQKTYPTAGFPSAEDAIRKFVSEPECAEANILYAAISVPGPVNDGEANVTKVGWKCNEARMRKELGIQGLYLLNDFDAVARALNDLRSDQLSIIREGSCVPGATALVIGPGTGLGVAGFKPGLREDTVIASEAAHIGYGAVNEEEIELLARFRHTLPQGKFSTVKTEDIVSGPGLARLYETISPENEKVSPAEVVRRLEDGDATASLAVNKFASFFGTVTANMVLALGAVGGVYLTGGVFQKIGKRFPNEIFMSRFTDNSNDACRAPLLAPIKVQAITEETPAFTGLLRFLRQKQAAL